MPADPEERLLAPHAQQRPAGSSNAPSAQWGSRQSRLVTDHAPVYPAVLEELLPVVWHRTDRYANNQIEADHGRLKSRLQPMRGLKQDRSARIVIAGHGFVQNLRRGHYELAVEEPTARRLTGRVRRACLGDLTPDRATTSRCRRLIRCNSAAESTRSKSNALGGTTRPDQVK
jgi:DDE domain